MQEFADRWILPIAGRAVRRCCLDHAFGIELRATDCADATIRIGGEFAFRESDGRGWRLRPEDDASLLGPALRMFGLTVDHAEAYKDGTLEVAFADGSDLRVAPDPAVEAWEFAGERGVRIVSLPGGDLAVWQPATPETTRGHSPTIA